MGPGYVPRVLASALSGLRSRLQRSAGSGACAPASRPLQLRPLIAILASVGVFARCCRAPGPCDRLRCRRAPRQLRHGDGRPVETIAFAVGFQVAAVLLFVKVLGLPIPIWPW